MELLENEEEIHEHQMTKMETETLPGAHRYIVRLDPVIVPRGDSSIYEIEAHDFVVVAEWIEFKIKTQLSPSGVFKAAFKKDHVISFEDEGEL